MSYSENLQISMMVDGSKAGECIIFNGLESSEEEEEVPVLYINSDKDSSACQTEPWDGDLVGIPHIPNIPIFFCTRLSPDIASTQCLIPINVAVGLDSCHPCLSSQSSKWNETEAAQVTSEDGSKSSLSSTAEEGTKSSGSTDYEHISELQQSESSNESAKVNSSPPRTVQVKEKRGRKRKVPVICDNVVERSIASMSSSSKFKKDVVKFSVGEAPVGKRKRNVERDTSKVVSGTIVKPSVTSLSSSSQSKPHDKNLGKRKRKAKRDMDYEYDVCASEDESKVELDLEDDDRDEDFRVEKEHMLSDEEFDYLSKKEESRVGKDISSGTYSEDTKSEVGNDDCEVPMSEDEESEDISEESSEGDVDSDEDGACRSLTSGKKNSKVLIVGINDLNSESERSKRLRKYLMRAKEKYNQEKVRKADGKVVYKCLKCDEEFTMRLHLTEHKKSHSTQVETYKCHHCNKVFTDARKYYLHLAFHDRLFKCMSCGRRFALLRNLKKHLTVHPGAPDQVCEVCSKQFSTTKELQLHHKAQHSEDNIKEYKVECEHCGRKYVREEPYKQHISKAPYKCSMCDASLGCEFKLKDHIRYEHGRCVCEFCGKSFKKRSLIHHIKIVHKEACVQCPHCPKKFAYRSKMLAHVDANHTDEKKYKCNQCNYTARTASSLNLHRRRVHSGPGSVPSYSCKVCGRKFYLPSKLTLHYRIHTGEKPYSCGTCGKAFASKYNMTEHERCVHGERMKLMNPDGTSTVRMVKHRRSPRAPGRRCDICGVHLPSSAAVLSHMKQNHNAQALPKISLVEDKDESQTESQVAEIELNRDNYEASTEQYEVIENAEQDVVLNGSSNLVTIPEYATHVEIDGVQYQVLRQ